MHGNEFFSWFLWNTHWFDVALYGYMTHYHSVSWINTHKNIGNVTIENIPSVQIDSVPLQLPSIRQDLTALPLSSWLSSHVKVQVSPRLGFPSPPSEQSILPLPGAVSGVHAILLKTVMYCRLGDIAQRIYFLGII